MKQTSFRIVVIGSGTPAMGVCCRGKETRLSSDNDEEDWGFIAKEEGEGSADGKLLKGNIGGKGNSG